MTIADDLGRIATTKQTNRTNTEQTDTFVSIKIFFCCLRLINSDNNSGNSVLNFTVD